MSDQKIIGNLTLVSRTSGYIRAPANVDGKIIKPEKEMLPAYKGDYDVDPSGETQTLQTDGMKMTDNLTINPILALTNQDIEALLVM